MAARVRAQVFGIIRDPLDRSSTEWLPARSNKGKGPRAGRVANRRPRIVSSKNPSGYTLTRLREFPPYTRGCLKNKLIARGRPFGVQGLLPELGPLLVTRCRSVQSTLL